MQVNKFITYLEDTTQLSNAAENELLPILQEFPYCQTGQLMYAIQLNANNSILFDEQLKKAASICTDRDRLFQSIHHPEKTTVAGATTEKEVEKPPLDNEFTKATPPIVADVPPTEEKDDLAILEKEYLTQAINQSLLVDFDAAEEEEGFSDVEEVAEKVELFDEESKHSFSSWLNHYSGNATTTVALEKQEQNIIDQFIQEDPTIKPEKKNFYSPTKMAQLSVADEGIVSETLAVIHVDQGNFLEAINTYEKLIVKNPKKRSYFAAQIKILKKKLK